jgi:hypothetical protein
MPRVDSNRGVPIPYRPGFAPSQGESLEGLARAVWDELQRIGYSLAALDQPMGASVYSSETIVVSKLPAITWTRLFDSGVTDSWANPSAALNSSTGVYTFAQEGVYSIRVRMTNPALPAPGNRSYYGGLRITVTYINGDPPVTYITQNGGFDDVPMTVFGSTLYPFQKGDSFTVDGNLAHDTIATTTTANCALEIVRVSGLGNNTL